MVVEQLCKLKGIDFGQEICRTKHLYALGSILLGYQDATVWGSGFGYDKKNSFFTKIDAVLHRYYHKLDIRAVRGPETKRILEMMKIKCPEVYGDPAVLLPRFYKKKPTFEKEYVVIPHYSQWENYKDVDNIVGTFTNDWKAFIDKLLEAKLVISGSLHGIIVAEAYGIPAIMLNATPSEDITKYKDWYYSTGRYDFPIAKSVEDALKMTSVPVSLDVIQNMQERLLATFPSDLWEN